MYSTGYSILITLLLHSYSLFESVWWLDVPFGSVKFTVSCITMYISVYIYSTVSIYDIKLYHSYRAVGSSPGVGRLIDQSGDAAAGSEIEVCSVDHSTRSTGKFFP